MRKGLFALPGRVHALLVFFCLSLIWPSAAIAEDATKDVSLLQWLVAGTAQTSTPHGVEVKEVVLPFFWDRAYKGQSGSLDLEVAFEVSTKERYALFANNLSNQYTVYVNGDFVEAFGVPGRSEARLPRLIDLDGHVHLGRNQLRVQIQAQSGYRGGISPLLIGPKELVRAEWERAWFWRYWWREGVVVFCGVVAFMGLLLGWIQRNVGAGSGQEARLFYYSAVAEMAFGFMALYTLVEAPPGGARLAGTLFAMAVTIWSVFVMLFGSEVAQWPRSGLYLLWRRWLWLLLVLGVVIAGCAGVFNAFWLLSTWYPVLSVSSVVFCTMVCAQAWRRNADFALRLLAFALLVNVCAGVVEAVYQRYYPKLDGGGSLYYCAALFGLVSMVVIAMRLREATRVASDLAANLSTQVLTKEAELRASFERVAHVQLQQERTAERARILRDMHDGVGAHISAAIRQLEGGTAPTHDVLNTLRESLDQLKLSIDAMHLPPGDLNAVLANVRYRMEPRLLSVGIRVVWDVDVVPEVARWDDKATRQFQFMVYECISNVLQHARATELRISARAQVSGNRITLADNGRGFDMASVGQRGLRAIHERARALGMRLDVRSEPGQTVVQMDVAPETAWG